MNNNNVYHQPPVGQAAVGIALLGAVNQQQQPIDRWAAGDPPLLPFIPVQALPPVPANLGHHVNAPVVQPHPAAAAVAAFDARHGARCPICYIRRFIGNNGWNVAEFSCGLVAGLCLVCVTFFAVDRAISACAKSAADGRAPAGVASVLGDRSASLASAVAFKLPCGPGAASPLTVSRR